MTSACLSAMNARNLLLLVGGLAADGAAGSALVEEVARLGGKLAADVFGLGEQVVQHARIEHLRDGERVFAFHVGRLAGSRLRRRLGRLGAEVCPRR